MDRELDVATGRCRTFGDQLGRDVLRACKRRDEQERKKI